jgi:eukaryotic-like serine/threonine-protein kinase
VRAVGGMLIVMRHPSAATTRLVTLGRFPRPAAPRLKPGETIESPETLLRFRVERLIGEGGFGQVYLAERLGRSSHVPQTVCIKVSQRIDGWLREAYFGQLLDGHPRAIRVYDAFPVIQPGGTLLYCLALEYARHGDLDVFLHRTTPSGWPESIVRREIAGILEVLGKLHRGQLLHRDLTPMNVFVCGPRQLKLGDFGIVRQQTNQRGITARTMNAITAPSEFLAGAAPKWQARDDVYQVGQLVGMLIKGDARKRIGTHDVRALACSDHLKEIIHRCIGERRKRYDSADDLIQALRHAPARLRSGSLRSLKGVHLAFTGILSRKRKDAIRAARRAGAIVHGSPSAVVRVVVRGRPNPLQAAGRDGGLKLMEIKRLREKGQRITLLNETQFWRLALRGRS